MDRNFGGNRGSRPMNRSGDRDGGFRNSPPVNVGEEFDVRIEAVGEKGDGVAKRNGFVIFIPGVKEGQNVRIKVTRVLRKVGFGEVVGNASGPVASEEKPKEEVEDEYSPDKDSDDFGEESTDDTSSDDSDPGTEDFGEEEDK